MKKILFLVLFLSSLFIVGTASADIKTGDGTVYSPSGTDIDIIWYSQTFDYVEGKNKGFEVGVLGNSVVSTEVLFKKASGDVDLINIDTEEIRFEYKPNTGSKRLDVTVDGDWVDDDVQYALQYKAGKSWVDTDFNTPSSPVTLSMPSNKGDREVRILEASEISDTGGGGNGGAIVDRQKEGGISNEQIKTIVLSFLFLLVLGLLVYLD